MKTQFLPELEENLLYCLYQDPLLRKSVEALDYLTVSFPEDGCHASPVAFSLIVRLKDGNQAMLQSEDSGRFADSLRMFLQIGMDAEEWGFLNPQLDTLEHALPALCRDMHACLSAYFRTSLPPHHLSPSTTAISFRDETCTHAYAIQNPSRSLTAAWQRFFQSKKSYFTFLSDRKTDLDALQKLEFLHIEESIQDEHERKLQVLRLDVRYQGDVHRIFHYRVKDQPDIQSPYVFGETVSYDPDTEGFNTFGAKLGERFGIPYNNGHDFEQQFHLFLDRESDHYRQLLQLFAADRSAERLKNAKAKIGQPVASVYEQKQEMIYVLQDGTRLKEC